MKTKLKHWDENASLPTMEFEGFLRLVPREQQVKTRQSTLELWHLIYCYVERQGFADTVDDFEFKEHISRYKRISTQALMANLRRMANCGLLTPHRLRFKGRHVDFLGAMMGAGSPTHMARYTLPGKDVPLRLKTNEDEQRAAVAAKRRYEQAQRDGPMEVRTVDDVTKLLDWLKLKQTEKQAITPDQNERLGKLVADAGAILRSMDANIQKLYIGAAMRSALEPGI